MNQTAANRTGNCGVTLIHLAIHPGLSRQRFALRQNPSFPTILNRAEHPDSIRNGANQ